MRAHFLMLILAGCPTPEDVEAPPAGEPPPEAPPAGAPSPEDASASTAPAAEQVTPEPFLLLRYERLAAENPPARTQDQVKAGAHVTLSGTVTCGGCGDALVLRALARPGAEEAGSGRLPDEATVAASPTFSPLLSVKLDKEGPFSIVVAKGADPVVLELMRDSNHDGKPTTGEIFLVHGADGSLVPDADHAGISLDASGEPAERPAPSGPPPSGPPPSGEPPSGPPPGEGSPGLPAPGDAPPGAQPEMLPATPSGPPPTTPSAPPPTP